MLGLRRLIQPHSRLRIKSLAPLLSPYPIRHFAMAAEMAGRESPVERSPVLGDGPIIEKWHGVVDAVTDTTKTAFPASPPFDAASPAGFQTYWRTVFTRLRQEVSANPEIPRHLTEPPVTKFTVTLFDNQHGLCCPCGHPDMEPNITLENEDGVTKEELMDGFINCMYGEAMPGVYVEPCPRVQEGDEEVDEEVDDDFEGYEDTAEAVEGPALVYTYAWMSSEFREDGTKLAYSTEPDIVLYCCQPEKYVKKRGEEGAEGVETKEADLESRAKL